MFALVGSVSSNRSTAYMADITGLVVLRGGRGAASQQGYLHLYMRLVSAKELRGLPRGDVSVAPLGFSRQIRCGR